MHAWALLRPLFQGRRLAAATAAVSLSAVGLVGFAGVASAHVNKVSGTAVCQSDGTYTVTWTVANDFNLSESVTAVSHSGGGTVSGLPTTIAASPTKPYNTATVTQAGVPGTAGFASITVKGIWTDGYSQTDTGQVRIVGDCNPAPTSVDTTCGSSGSYTIPMANDGYYFQVKVNGTWTTVSAGTTDAAGGTTVQIRLMQKHRLRPDAQVGSWTFSFTAPRDCVKQVTPGEPQLNQSGCDGSAGYVGSISIPTTVGVIYKDNGVVVTSDITTPGHHVITAEAAPGYTFGDASYSWDFTLNEAPTCAWQQPTLGVTTSCNSVTYAFANDSVRPEVTEDAVHSNVTLGLQPGGSVTFDIYKSTDGGSTWTKADSVTVDPDQTASKTLYGAGKYEVRIGKDPQDGSDATVTGNCPVPPPPPASIVSVSGSVTSSCPTVAGTTGSYVVDVTNAAQSTQSVQVKVSDGAKVLATSGDIASGKSFSYTGTLTAGQGAALKADFSADGGATWTAVALSGSPTIVCPTVLGEQFNQPPTSKPTIDPTSKPTQTLPFTGIPVVPTVLLALGLVMGGTLMVVIARRGRGELLNG